MAHQTPLGRYARRRFLRASLALAVLQAAGRARLSAAQPPASGQRPAGEARDAADARPDLERLVAANRILANENVVDAFGHVSIRDPEARERFVLSRSLSPALVGIEDLMRFELDGTAVGGDTRTAYGERMIHAAIYERRPDVGAVVHHHAYPVLPFTITGVPLEPVVHTAAIIGARIPVWDIRDRYGDTDMLVRTIEQGRDLAAALGDNTCVLMRGHGAVVTGASVQRAVLAAVYLQVNANVALQARALGDTAGLSDGEIARATEAQFSPLALDRAWEYFCRRAGIEPR